MTDKQLKLIKFEHSCLLVVNQQNHGLLIDPGKHSRLPDNLTNIEVLIVSDEHADHFDIDNLKQVLDQSPSVEIFSTVSVAEQLAKNSIKAVAVIGSMTIQRLGMEIELNEGDHAVVYGSSPCKILTVAVDDFLYYPSDSFIGTGKSFQVLGLPIGGPWFNMTDAIDFMKAVDSQYVLEIHDFHLSQAGRDVNHFFIANNLDPGRQFLKSEP